MMSTILTILISLQGLLQSGDTLRHDGYYMKVGEQAESWHLLYFMPDGSFMDSTSRGTPPVFEKEDLGSADHKFHLSSTKKSQVLSLSPGALTTHIGDPAAVEYQYQVERGDLVITGWLDSRKKKWHKMKDRYFFVPF